MIEKISNTQISRTPTNHWLSPEEVEIQLQALVHEERKRTVEILQLINIAEEKKIYLHRGYSSLFDWITKVFGYSEAAAYRRIQAARLLQTLPEVSRKVASGEVNLTTLSKTQAVIKADEKITGLKWTPQKKAELVEKIENKSLKETEKVLAQQFPKAVYGYERCVLINESVTKLTLNISGESLSDLERVKDILSHTLPEANFAQVIGYLAKDFLKRKDPLKKKKIDSAAAKQCVNKITESLRRQVIQRDQGQCTYKDPKTGKKCGSTYQVEVDHILPQALGGNHELNNLRCLCKSHNLLMSQKILGSKVAHRWKNGLR